VHYDETKQKQRHQQRLHHQHHADVDFLGVPLSQRVLHLGGMLQQHSTCQGESTAKIR
jgi:hypothetical protein